MMLTATLTGATNPTAPIAFFDVTTNTALGSVDLSDNTATLTTNALALGNHTIRATYPGDANNPAAEPVSIIRP